MSKVDASGEFGEAKRLGLCQARVHPVQQPGFYCASSEAFEHPGLQVHRDDAAGGPDQAGQFQREETHGKRFVQSTNASTRLVFNLFTQYGEAITDLEVRRSSLEDTYLSLVHRAESGLSDVPAPSDRNAVAQ